MYLSNSQGAYLCHDGEMLAYARKVGRNYVLYPQSTAGQDSGQDDGEDRGRHVGQNDTSQEKEPNAYTLWHRRLGHVGEEKMRLLQTNVEGIPALVPRRRTCKTCALTKSAKTINRDALERTTRLLQRVLYRFLGAIRRPHAQRGKVYAHVHGRLHTAVVGLPD
jgi:GAG-pre-integrase domain